MPLSRATSSNVPIEINEYVRQEMERIAERQRTRAEQAMQSRFTEGTYTWVTSDTQQFYNTVTPDMAYAEPQLRRPSRSISEMLGREPSQLMQRRKREKEEVERLIKTGASEQTKYVDESGTLFVMGYDMGDTAILFTLDSEAITAYSKRSKHLKPLLTNLAKQEGLELRFIDTPPDQPEGAREVLYYAFKNREEVDDSELVAVTKPRFQPQEEQHDVEEGCRNRDCVECYGDEDDYEPDEMPF